jgi:hypothetical protein
MLQRQPCYLNGRKLQLFGPRPENTAPILVRGADRIDKDSFLHCCETSPRMRERVYVAVAWQCVTLFFVLLLSVNIRKVYINVFILYFSILLH